MSILLTVCTVQAQFRHFRIQEGKYVRSSLHKTSHRLLQNDFT